MWKDCKSAIKECPSCGSKSLTYYSRIIGYLTAVKNWSDAIVDDALKSIGYSK